MESMAGGASSGAGSDCEGEDQEDPSSSNTQDVAEATGTISSDTEDVAEATGAIGAMSLADDAKEKEEDALALFRQQWQRELVSTPSPQRQMSPAKVDTPATPLPEPDNEEERAKQLFLLGTELERGGRLYEAVQHYKRAVTLLPDVERRLWSSEQRPDTPEVEPAAEPEVAPRSAPTSGSEDEADDVDLLARINRILARKGRWCEPAVPQKDLHISSLPLEVVQVVLRWTVSAELDAAAMERVGRVCRGLYVAARDPALWRALCARTWGLDCGTPKAHGYPCWRHMFISRPRLLHHGCYISKTTYLRHGENSFQDTFYKPWYLIEYYRYLRFFPEGLVMMWTTADEPAACVAHLKHRGTKNLQGIMYGHYRLIGDKVVVILRKQAPDKKPAQSSNTRFRSRRKDSAIEQQEQMFHLELQLRTVRSRRNWQLAWRGYSVSSRREQWSHFDLQPGKFPPFAFSPVRGYTSESVAPLY